MVLFRKTLQEYLEAKCQEWVGADVKTFDDHLHAFDLEVDPEPFPFVVVNVRLNEKEEPGEMGTDHDLRTWTVHIYYIDANLPDYAEGQDRRDKVLGTLERELEKDRRLGGLSYTDDKGIREYVFDSDVKLISFDSSGQEEYYTFVSELHMLVYTAKT